MLTSHWLTSPLPISTLLLLFFTIVYLIAHHYYQRHSLFSLLDIGLNYIPVLTHEFGHVLFNRLSGGRTLDLVVVATRRERNETGQQGYAITQSKSKMSQILTTIGGYLMPPIMFSFGLFLQSKGQGVFFILLYIIIFLYFTFKTSRKLVPISIIIFLALISYLGIQSTNFSNYSYIYMIVYHFMVGTLLGEIIQSTLTIIKLTFTKPSPTWDGTTLRHLTNLPVMVFSCLWVVINLFVAFYFIQSFILK